mmetsp:Transcript_19789/g.40360  ORF Transcript_19789/g.40360 Transcript_19789/m.40360 type:complete len:375 (+) Transcript_19789:490-1614(+)
MQWRGKAAVKAAACTPHRIFRQLPNDSSRQGHAAHSSQGTAVRQACARRQRACDAGGRGPAAGRRGGAGAARVKQRDRLQGSVQDGTRQGQALPGTGDRGPEVETHRLLQQRGRSRTGTCAARAGSAHGRRCRGCRICGGRCATAAGFDGGRGRGAAAAHLWHRARSGARRRRALCVGVRRAIQHAPPRHLRCYGQGCAARCQSRCSRPKSRAGRSGWPRPVGNAQVDGSGDGASARAGWRAHRRRWLPPVGEHRAGAARPQRARVTMPLAARAQLGQAVGGEAPRARAERGDVQARAYPRRGRGGGGEPIQRHGHATLRKLGTHAESTLHAPSTSFSRHNRCISATLPADLLRIVVPAIEAQGEDGGALWGRY